MYNTNICISKRFPKPSNSPLTLVNIIIITIKFQYEISRWFLSHCVLTFKFHSKVLNLVIFHKLISYPFELFIHKFNKLNSNQVTGTQEEDIFFQQDTKGLPSGLMIYYSSFFRYSRLPDNQIQTVFSSSPHPSILTIRHDNSVKYALMKSNRAMSKAFV